MTVNDSPCKGCEYRAPTCHDTCEPYRDYREKQTRITSVRKKEDAWHSYCRGLNLKKANQIAPGRPTRKKGAK